MEASPRRFLFGWLCERRPLREASAKDEVTGCNVSTASRESPIHVGCRLPKVLSGDPLCEAVLVRMAGRSVTWKCACGKLSGVAHDVGPSGGKRVICYCDDCQNFAHFLGKARETLDEHGGTDIFQIRPSQLEITNGREHLACLSLKEGSLLRWYASCCKTPLANTGTTKNMHFVGVVDKCFDHGPEPGARERDLGPVKNRVFGKFANGQVDAHPGIPPLMIAGFIPILLWRSVWHRNAPTPFFDKEGKSVAEPHVLTEAERAALPA